MANHGSTGSQSHGFADHKSTYDNFIKGSIALTIICLFILVALVAFAFAPSSLFPAYRWWAVGLYWIYAVVGIVVFRPERRR